MIKQLIIGLACEGTTDQRFLTSIVKRTFEEVILQHSTNVEILDIQYITSQEKAFVEYVYEASIKGTADFGILILCLHADADASTDTDTFKNKINPAIENLKNKKRIDLCKIVTPIVPIKMIEAWMIADEQCFLDEVGSTSTLANLGISKNPELISDPKTIINAAIKKVFENKPKRRSRPKITELYLPIGQKCDLSKLENLSSYIKFKTAVKKSLEEIKYIVEKKH